MSTKNGTTNKPVVSQTEAETTKPELSNLSVVVDRDGGELKTQDNSEKLALPSIEARLKRLEELQELNDKRQTIVDALGSLNKFYINPTGQGCNLKLTDSKGNSFGIAHPMVIGEMVHLAKTKLQDELLKIENEFVFTV